MRQELLKIIIPAQTARDHYAQINRFFTDLEIAAMLWNSCIENKELLKHLKKLAEITEDAELKTQIVNHLRYEEEAYCNLAQNTDRKYVYVVAYNDEGFDCGYFAKLNLAIEYAKKDGERGFSIRKQFIVDDELPRVKIWETNPNLVEDNENGEVWEEYCGEGSISFDKNGEMLSWYAKLPEKIEKLADYWGNTNFKNYPIRLDNLFEKGDIVKFVINDSIGIIRDSKEDMEAFYKSVDDGLYVEYIDTATITVEFIEADRSIHHEHMSMLTLEKIELNSLPEKDRQYVDCAANLIKGKGSLDYFLLLYQDGQKNECHEYLV